jgi:diacylglycerol kinase (ATP)
VTLSAPVRLLVNPAAGRGRALRRLETAQHALARVGPFDVVTTRAAGDEARLAREAVRDGVRTLVVLGGDGTISRVASALVESGGDTALAILGAGTGNDLAKSLGAPVFDYAAMAERIVAREVRRIDVGEIDGRVFVNAAGVGFDVAVLERTLNARWLRGDVLYAVTALGQLFSYRGFAAEVGVAVAEESDTLRAIADTAAAHAPRWLTVVIANGQWFGGTFRIAPDASLSDGALDLVAISDASPLRRAQLFGGAPFGRHVHAPEVHYAQHSRVTLRFAEPPLYQADGELYQASSASLEVRVRSLALSVIA